MNIDFVQRSHFCYQRKILATCFSTIDLSNAAHSSSGRDSLVGCKNKATYFDAPFRWLKFVDTVAEFQPHSLCFLSVKVIDTFRGVLVVEYCLVFQGHPRSRTPRQASSSLPTGLGKLCSGQQQAQLSLPLVTAMLPVRPLLTKPAK